MASKKLSSDTSLANSYKLSRGVASVARPSAPTIGTATDTGTGAVSVTFTASTLGPTASSFTLTSSSGVTASGASSPLTLQEAAIGTYMYTVYATNANGNGPSSSASNSVVVASVTPPNSYESIATNTLSSNQSSITFSSLGSFTHLQLRSMCFGTTDDENLYMRFNGDTGSNYARHYLDGNGATTSASATAPDTGGVFSNTSNGTSPYVSVTDILDYANTNKFKTIRALSGRDVNGSGGDIALRSSLWRSTSAVTSITILAGGGTLSSGSQFALYGIRG